jgi:hypothetical protein
MHLQIAPHFPRQCSAITQDSQVDCFPVLFSLNWHLNPRPFWSGIVRYQAFGGRTFLNRWNPSLVLNRWQSAQTQSTKSNSAKYQRTSHQCNLGDKQLFPFSPIKIPNLTWQILQNISLPSGVKMKRLCPDYRDKFVRGDSTRFLIPRCVGHNLTFRTFPSLFIHYSYILCITFGGLRLTREIFPFVFEWTCPEINYVIRNRFRDSLFWGRLWWYLRLRAMLPIVSQLSVMILFILLCQFSFYFFSLKGYRDERAIFPIDTFKVLISSNYLMPSIRNADRSAGFFNKTAPRITHHMFQSIDSSRPLIGSWTVQQTLPMFRR